MDSLLVNWFVGLAVSFGKPIAIMHHKQWKYIWAFLLAFSSAWLIAYQRNQTPVADPPDSIEGPLKIKIDVSTSTHMEETVATLPLDRSPTKTPEPTRTAQPTPTLAPQLQSTVSVLTTEQSVIPVTLTSAPPVTATSASITGASELPPEDDALPTPTVIGHSLGGRPIEEYQLGHGKNKIVLIGGMHGGYEWNTIQLVYKLLGHFLAQPQAIPPSVTLHFFPSANPDGQFAVTGLTGRFHFTDVLSNTVPGRFNSRGVDLNRNWDCQWQPTGTWRDRAVSGGTGPFSEPETRVLRDFLLTLQPTVVVFYHSAANGVFAAGCPDVYQTSMDLATSYSLASGYPVYDRFHHYEVNGDASDWLSIQKIPSFAVELKSHEGLDWQMNLAGVEALLNRYATVE